MEIQTDGPISCRTNTSLNPLGLQVAQPYTHLCIQTHINFEAQIWNYGHCPLWKWICFIAFPLIYLSSQLSIFIYFFFILEYYQTTEPTAISGFHLLYCQQPIHPSISPTFKLAYSKHNYTRRSDRPRCSLPGGSKRGRWIIILIIGN